MKRAIISVVYLLCYVGGIFANPVPKEVQINEIWNYLYLGQIDSGTSAHEEILSRWTVTANLTIEVSDSIRIAKLSNVITNLYNGPRSDLSHAKEKEIPLEAKIIEQPFVLHKVGDYLSINLIPNEPIWSINMKKAIGTAILFDRDDIHTEGDSKCIVKSETSIYGICEVTSCKDDEGQSKIIHLEKCDEYAIDHVTNTFQAPATNHFQPLNIKSSKTYTDCVTFGDVHPCKIKSVSNITYQMSPSAAYTQHIDQEQYVELKSVQKIHKTNDISVYTEKRSLVYEFGDEPTNGRHINNQNTSALIEQFLENYNEFAKEFFYNGAKENYDISKRDQVENMYLALMNLDVEGLERLENNISKVDEGWLSFIYITFLPYIGTNSSVKYLSSFLQTNKTRTNEQYAIRMLGAFPNHIINPSDELLVELEPLMDMNNTEHQSLKNAGVLSFASTLSRIIQRNKHTKYLLKYVELFYKKFTEAQNYEERLVYLCALINIAHNLDIEFMNQIATNASDISHIRTFAIMGFKHQLVLKPDLVFKVYWPIVQNKSENINVRVASLDLLLSTNLKGEQLNEIVKAYSHDFNEPEDRQLANYLLTSLHSLQKTTAYNDNLGVLASKVLKNIKIRPYPASWASGQYRVAFTDSEPNFGASVDARLITDPKTNLMNIVHLSFNEFAASFDFGTYSLYLNLNGAFDSLYVSQCLSQNKPSSIPELLQLLKDNKFEIEEPNEDVHIDVIIFMNNKVIYVSHLNKFTKSDQRQALDELGFLLLEPKYISFPITDFKHIPSELGTPIKISNYVQDILFYSLEIWEILVTSSWQYQIWLESYNPLVDADIANFKYYVTETYLNMTYDVNQTEHSFMWINNDDLYSNIWENNMGTAVENENILKEYCQNCSSYKQVTLQGKYNADTLSYPPFGFTIDVESQSGDQKSKQSKDVNNVLYNIDAFPLAGWFLKPILEYNNKFWLNSELSRGFKKHSVKSGLTDVKTVVKIDFDADVKLEFKHKRFINFSAEVKNYKLKTEEYFEFCNVTAGVILDFSGDPHVTAHQELKATYNSTLTNTTMQVSVERGWLFPNAKGDKLSLLPPEPALGKIIIKKSKAIEEGEINAPDTVMKLTEMFSSSDKKNKIVEKTWFDDYERCISDSKQSKYTAPTKECKRISAKLGEYDQYLLQFVELQMRNNNKLITKDINEPIAEFNREDEDLVTFKIRMKYPEKEYTNFTVYYPRQIINPVSSVFNERDLAIPGILTSTCTISPSTIEQFSGKYISNNNENWLAFAECYNVSTRGLTGHTIGKNNVGFKLISGENVLEATVKQGKLDVQVNGKEVCTNCVPTEENFKVYFLDENAINIVDAGTEIYYNTEYVSIKVNALYPKFLCGLCTKN